MSFLKKKTEVLISNTFSPVSIKKNHDELIKKLSKVLGRGEVLDVFELEGCFALENSETVFRSLKLGDKLEITNSDDDKLLIAINSCGAPVGYLPYSISLLPKLIMQKGVSLRCYVEYIDYTNEVLTICVSLYAERY